jgi:hypothetical protein
MSDTDIPVFDFGEEMAEFMVWEGQAKFLESDKRRIGLFTGAGNGKCLRKGTKLLRSSGDTVEVQNVVPGDRLLGMCGIRTVEKTVTGYGLMYEVRPVIGTPHFVNGDHILTLVCSGTKEFSKWKDGDIQDVSVKEWLAWGPARKKRWKLFYSEAVDFERSLEAEVISPYVMGLLLGDGSILSTPTVTTMSPVILEAWSKEAARFGLRVCTPNDKRTAPTWYASGTPGVLNPITKELRRLGVHGHNSGNKFIPDLYKFGSQQTRLELLAGLMDTDGSKMNTCYDYTSKSQRLAEDVVFVAKSLGILATISPCMKGCQTGAVGKYWRVILSGATKIPSRIKKLPERKQIKKVLRTGFSITPVGEETYYGFSLDGDARFLLADFMVSHNSRVLTVRAIMDGVAQDGWWENELSKDWKGNPLRLVMAAPHSRYITNRLAPAFRGMLSSFEAHIGRPIHSPTGKNRNGWFDSKDERRQEMKNGVVFNFYGLHDEESAIAADVAGMYIDEGTFLTSHNIWTRANQRVRDPRALVHRVAVVGTPEKSHFLYEVFFDPTTDLPRPDVDAFTDSALSNPMLDPGFFEDAAHASTAMIDMQVFGKWVKGVGGQRFSHVFDEATHLVEMDMSPRKYPDLIWHIGMDPGWATGSVIMSRKSPKRNAWMVYDEIVIEGMQMEETLADLQKRGFRLGNIKSFSSDPKDSHKRHSNSLSKESVADIIRRVMGIRPKCYQIPNTGALLTRLDVIDRLLRERKLFINKALLPRSRKTRGIINALRNFAFKEGKDTEGHFIDEITSETKNEWKHSIDALHYILMNNEYGYYRQAALGSQVTRGKHRRLEEDQED